MKKIIILAMSALLVANLSAQEPKHECKDGKQFSKEEFVEMEIGRLTHELMLSDEQAEKFAKTYREYAAKRDEIFPCKHDKKEFEPGKRPTDAELDKMAKARFEVQKKMAELKAKYYDIFRKELSARQVMSIFEDRHPGPQQPGPCCKKGKEFKGREFKGERVKE